MITGTIQERGSGIWTSGMGVLDYVTILDIYIYTYLHTYISTIGPLVPIVMITTGTIVIILVITKMKIQTIYVAVTMNNHDCGWLSLLPLVFIYIYIIYPKLWKCWWGKWWPLDVSLPCYSDKPLGIYFLNVVGRVNLTPGECVMDILVIICRSQSFVFLPFCCWLPVTR